MRHNQHYSDWLENVSNLTIGLVGHAIEIRGGRSPIRFDFHFIPKSELILFNQCDLDQF